MFQTEPYKAINQLKHKNRELAEEFRSSIYRINTSQHLVKDRQKIKINKFLDRNNNNLMKMQKTIYKKDYQPPLIKIWNRQFEKIIKLDRTKNLPFYSINKILRILETYPEIKYKVSFFVYPSDDYQAINITYKQFIAKFLKINYNYITQNINKKSIVSEIFQKLCQCLRNVDMSPVYSTGQSMQNTIQQILKQNNIIFNNDNKNINKNGKQITRQKIYEQKFEQYKKMMEEQENEKNDGNNNMNKSDQKDKSNIKQLANESFLSELHKKETFSEEWINMIEQKQKHGYQELQKNKLFNSLPSFKRNNNKDRKLDSILQSIQKFKKQSQYMIKMLQDRLSY